MNTKTLIIIILGAILGAVCFAGCLQIYTDKDVVIYAGKIK